MGRVLVGGVVLLLLVAIVSAVPATASEDKLLRLLVKKGLITEQEAVAIQKEVEAEAIEPQPTPREVGEALRDEVRQELRRRELEAIGLTLRLEGEARWREFKDVGNRHSGSDSELFLRRAWVGLDARPLDFVTARLVLSTEWFGADTTDQGQRADSEVTLEEATIKLRSDDFPLYGIVGFRTQPFGVFFPRLVTDPMTQDAYEVKQVGATVGLKAKKWDVDLSATVYRGETQMDHFFASGLFDSTSVVRSTDAGLRRAGDHIGSMIVSATASPLKDLVLGTAFLSEPGDRSRNETAAAWIGLTLGRVSAEVEFAAAVDRERYVLRALGERLSRSFDERILTLGAIWRVVKPLELIARYERFWDGGLARHAGVWSAENRISVGVGYTLYERDETLVKLLAEYRFTTYRRAGDARQLAAPEQNEAFAKLVISYR